MICGERIAGSLASDSERAPWRPCAAYLASCWVASCSCTLEDLLLIFVDPHFLKAPFISSCHRLPADSSLATLERRDTSV